MSNTAGEIAKYFLNKNWAISALSIVCGFFVSVAVIPAEWRDVIPFQNKDWNVVTTIIITSLAFYLLFYLIYWFCRKVSDNRHYSKLRKENDAYENEQAKTNVIHTIDYWNENDYQNLMRLINNGNKPIKTFLAMGSNIRPNWFKIVPVKETPKPKKNDGKVHQEVWGSGAAKISLKPEAYSFLKQIYDEEGSLTSNYRPFFDFNEIIKEENEGNN